MKAAGYPPPSVVVERDVGCHPTLIQNCNNPTIFRYVQDGHDNSMLLPSVFAHDVLKFRKGWKPTNKAPKYIIHILIACLPCTPYSPLGQRWGFRSGTGRAFCELFRLLEDTQVDSGFIEQSPGFCTASEGKCFNMLLQALQIDVKLPNSLVIHNTSNRGSPQGRNRFYCEYILRGGPDPTHLLALDLSPSLEFIAERETQGSGDMV